jgi:hypothetical protein
MEKLTHNLELTVFVALILVDFLNGNNLTSFRNRSLQEELASELA